MFQGVAKKNMHIVFAMITKRLQMDCSGALGRWTP
jgi:hypothetical protein